MIRKVPVPGTCLPHTNEVATVVGHVGPVARPERPAAVGLGPVLPAVETPPFDP